MNLKQIQTIIIMKVFNVSVIKVNKILYMIFISRRRQVQNIELSLELSFEIFLEQRALS